MMTTDTLASETVYSEEFEHPDIVANQAFGFWIYIMSDLILFATLFATYIVLRNHYAGGSTGKDLFDLFHVFIETMLLLFSSTTCGMAMLAMHSNKKNLVLLWLAVTFLLGLGFVLLEISEFHSMIIAGNGPDRSAFLSAFFTLVSTHGIHVSFGLIWMAVMMGQVIVKNLTTPIKSRLIRLSMFWHFLDIVWICIFTIVYLMGIYA